jgi:FAD/FMN-containing dehydrogenase
VQHSPAGIFLKQIATDIADVIGTHQVLDSAAVAERATSYWNSAPMQAAAMAIPSSTDEISAVLRTCNNSGQAVITHGGLTNAVAAVEPNITDLVLSTEKMNAIVDIDKIGGFAVVEAGALLQNVQEAVAEEGLRFPLDLGARGSCTIGGNIATNAGGINVLRYGMMRNLVLGLEAVLADGTIISAMNRMLKNNAGYDTKQLFIGSEGSLGVVSRAVLRLFPQPASRQSALVAMHSFDDVIELLGHVQSRLAGTLSAFEVVWGEHYRAVTEEGWLRAPLARDYGYYVVFQAEGDDPAVDEQRFEAVLEDALEKGYIVDAVIPKSESEVQDIWRVREDFDAILEVAPCYLYDVSLPIRAMQAYVDEVKRNVSSLWKDGRCFTLGHVADGNLHFFISPCAEGDNHHAVDKCVYEPLQKYAGSVSAEHGIGVEKVRWLQHSKSKADIDLMRMQKRNMDPNNILNPGRIFDAKY